MHVCVCAQGCNCVWVCVVYVVLTWFKLGFDFKKFRKQQTGAPRAAISLVQYVPSAMNQTVIADWFKDNAEVTTRELEQEKLTQECDEFWEFEASQTGRKKKLTNSRR